MIIDCEQNQSDIEVSNARTIKVSSFPLSTDRRKFKSWAAIVTFDEDTQGYLKCHQRRESSTQTNVTG